MHGKVVFIALLFLACAAVAAAAEPEVYPAKGQTPEQQERDEFECHQWATKDTGVDPAGSGAGTFGEKLVYQMTDAMTLKESLNSLFKENDLADWLYAFDVGVTAKINSRFSLSFDLLDTFKNRPVDGLTHKHDVAIVTSIVTKY